MRALVQRVLRARVTVVDEITGEREQAGSIGAGLCVFVGVTHTDTAADAARLAEKLWRLRLLADDEGAMNRSAADTGAPFLVVSQFTLYSDTSRGRRPSWVAAARPDVAEPLVDEVVGGLRRLGAPVETGRFGAHMEVDLVNDGPVTVLIEVP